MIEEWEIAPRINGIVIVNFDDASSND